MIRLRPSGVDEILIKRVQDWYEPGSGVFITSTSTSTLFSPAMLFTGSTTGAWYDPSDTTTLYRDAAGTLPVTAVEQPVGLMLDKSGKGNHAFNSSGNSANFPVLSARYNLLTKTEDFSNATAWPPTDTTPTADAIAAPNGTVTADLLTQGAAGTANIKQVVTVPSGVTATASVYLKRGNTDWVRVLVLDETGGTNSFRVWVNLATGQKGSANISGSGVLVSADVVPAGNDWYRVILTGSNPSTTSYALYLVAVTGDNTSTRQSSGTYHPWGASLTVANDGVNIPYQRVNTSSDYDTVGFKPYLKFNGNQWLQTNSIDFTYGDKMFVCAGVRKLSATTYQLLCEISANASQNNGAFGCFAPDGASNTYGFNLRGVSANPASGVYYVPAGYTPPTTSVLSCSYDIGAADLATELIPRINGSLAQVGGGGTTAGTGNFGNYAMYFGARAGAFNWFNGRLYGLVIAGKQASADEITSTETYINQRTGAF